VVILVEEEKNDVVITQRVGLAATGDDKGCRPPGDDVGQQVASLVAPAAIARRARAQKAGDGAQPSFSAISWVRVVA
jgi:hypothetical protein